MSSWVWVFLFSHLLASTALLYWLFLLMEDVGHDQRIVFVSCRQYHADCLLLFFLTSSRCDVIVPRDAQDISQISLVKHIRLGRRCPGFSSIYGSRSPPGHWYSTLRPCNAGAPSATLATGTPARRLQGGHVRPSVAVWHFTDVLSRRLPSCRRCSWTTTTLHREPNMRRCRTYSSFGDRAFAAAGPVLWNSLPSHLKEAD